MTPCNSHFRKIAEHVKRGVSEAGGFPVEFPVFSNGESNLRPTAMLTRNLASMDVEESIRGNPMDAVVLLVGCDKTTPALADRRGPGPSSSQATSSTTSTGCCRRTKAATSTSWSGVAVLKCPSTRTERKVADIR